VVTGRDALSGVNPGTIAPVSVTPSTWTDFGSDEAEIRVYRIIDRADNSLVLTMKVKREPDEFEFSVMELRYNDSREAKRPQRNTIEFERLIGRSHDHPLLAVEQEVSFGVGSNRCTVIATYDVLHDETEIERLRADRTGEGKASEDQTGDKQRSGEKSGAETEICKQENDKGDPEQRGLILLRIVTDKGRLKLEE
jgi:hypothetical protein